MRKAEVVLPGPYDLVSFDLDLLRRVGVNSVGLHELPLGI
jgi:hypothetical protein